MCFWQASACLILYWLGAVSTKTTNFRMLDPWAALLGGNRDNDSLVHELELLNRVKSRRVADAMHKVCLPCLLLLFRFDGFLVL